MNYVINLEDGGGLEFFLSEQGRFLPLSDPGGNPQTFKTHKQVNRHLASLRSNYPATCRLYALDGRDFDRRREVLRAGDNPGLASQGADGVE